MWMKSPSLKGEQAYLISNNNKMKIVANYLFGKESVVIKPSSPKRDWMDETQDKYAYRCLPMVIANQHSWDAICPGDIQVTWEGDNSFKGVKIDFLDYTSFNFASSLFGYGVLTFHVDFVLQTDENISIYVKGPANSFKPKIQSLEGIVETNWLPFTFTANWKFTEPGIVRFKKGEPLFSFFPINTSLIEEHEIISRNINEDEDFKIKHDYYSESRNNHLAEGNTNGESWQKYYMKGINPSDNTVHKNHKTRLQVKKIS
jgi:hypothetical protein